jgi:hypothetical protein
MSTGLFSARFGRPGFRMLPGRPKVFSALAFLISSIPISFFSFKLEPLRGAA